MSESKGSECLVCAEPIKSSASKCKHCGSFQDFRRHVPFGNTALALIVAILALLSPVIDTISTQYELYLKRNEKRVELALVEVLPSHVSALVSNRSSSSIVIDRIGCIVSVPFDPTVMYVVNSDEEIVEIAWPRARDTIGSSLVTYRPNENFLLAASEQAYLNFSRTHVVPPKQALIHTEDDDDDIVRSFCTIGAVSEFSELEVDNAIMRPSELLRFDALEFIGAADWSAQQADEKKALQSKILTIRAEKTE